MFACHAFIKLVEKDSHVIHTAFLANAIPSCMPRVLPVTHSAAQANVPLPGTQHLCASHCYPLYCKGSPPVTHTASPSRCFPALQSIICHAQGISSRLFTLPCKQYFLTSDMYQLFRVSAQYNPNFTFLPQFQHSPGLGACRVG